MILIYTRGNLVHSNYYFFFYCPISFSLGYPNFYGIQRRAQDSVTLSILLTSNDLHNCCTMATTIYRKLNKPLKIYMSLFCSPGKFFFLNICIIYPYIKVTRSLSVCPLSILLPQVPLKESIVLATSLL